MQPKSKLKFRRIHFLSDQLYRKRKKNTMRSLYSLLHKQLLNFVWLCRIWFWRFFFDPQRKPMESFSTKPICWGSWSVDPSGETKIFEVPLDCVLAQREPRDSTRRVIAHHYYPHLVERARPSPQTPEISGGKFQGRCPNFSRITLLLPIFHIQQRFVLVIWNQSPKRDIYQPLENGSDLAESNIERDGWMLVGLGHNPNRSYQWDASCYLLPSDFKDDNPNNSNTFPSEHLAIRHTKSSK